MMKTRVAFAAFLTLALVVASGMAADALKSGPQVGQDLPGPFHPLNVNGENAGQKFCLYCKNGNNPVAMVFAREVNEPVVQLIKKLDAATGKNSECQLGSFVVFLGDSEGLEPKLKKVADQASLKHTVLSIDNPAGPQDYNVAKDADVTVVLYKNRKVQSNHAFKKGQLKDKDIEQILSDLPKITTK